VPSPRLVGEAPGAVSVQWYAPPGSTGATPFHVQFTADPTPVCVTIGRPPGPTTRSVHRVLCENRARKCTGRLWPGPIRDIVATVRG
jgi:hypothetical protein